VIIYTDARYSPNDPDPAQIGVAIYDPETVKPGCTGWTHSDLIIGPSVMACLQMRTQYVTQLEYLAGIVPYTSRPDALRGRDVIHFVDNTGALFGLAKGSSMDEDSARLAHTFHCAASALDANVWLEYVASGANLADHPSRGDFALLHSMGSVRFEIALPDLGADWASTYRSVFLALSPRPSKGVKRRRAEIDREVSRMRSVVAARRETQ
jgi:hypothetical protein